MISLKNIRDRIGQVEGYIKTTDANNYIANQGTVSSTNNLAGLPLTHYNCNGSCSWACSGSCSKGAGGGGGEVRIVLSVLSVLRELIPSFCGLIFVLVCGNSRHALT